MYAVIFRAVVQEFDAEYVATAAALRDLALTQFGCLEFCAVAEGDQEIALSYWPDLVAIQAWKRQADHIMAQKLGRERWYKSYRIQIARVEQDYSGPKAVL